MGEINGRRNGDKMLGKKKAGFGRKMKRARTHDKARSKHGGEHGLHVLETRNIKIKDLIIGKRFRQPREEDVAQLAESLKKLGQPRAITVRPSRLNGKHPVIAGVSLVKAAEMLNWTRVRADIVKCTNAQARQWEIAENLYRAHLTALEEAKHIAEWVRLVADPESVSRQDVAKPKGGRPEGAITKAARTLPIKGKTQKARRKAIERGLKIAFMSPEGEAAAKKAGLDNNREDLREIANEDTAKAQVEKVQEIAHRKASPKTKALMHGSGKRKTKRSKRPTLHSSLSAEEENRVENLLEMWHGAHDLNRAFAKETPAVREGFFEKLRQSVGDNEPEDDLEASEQEDEQDVDTDFNDEVSEGDAVEGEDDDIDGDDDSKEDEDIATFKKKKGKKAKNKKKSSAGWGDWEE
jgi:ParB/RepB/Spo0J family partition protein